MLNKVSCFLSVLECTLKVNKGINKSLERQSTRPWCFELLTMRSKSTLIVHLSFLLSTLSRTGANFYGANYWNDRYSGQGINYETGKLLIKS